MPYVLHDFSKADHEWLDKALAGIAEAAPLLVADDDPGFMTKVALLVSPPRKTLPPPAALPGGAGVGSTPDEDD